MNSPLDRQKSVFTEASSLGSDPAAVLERMIAAVETVPALMCVARGGSIVFANQHGVRMLGATDASDLIGQPLATILGSDYQMLLEDDGAAWIEEMTATPIRLRRLDGGEFEANATTRATMAGGMTELTLVALDASERKRVSEALLQSEQRFKDFADASSDWLWETDGDIAFTYLSPSFYRYFGKTPEQVIGKHRHDLALNPDDEIWREHRAQLDAHLPFRDFTYEMRLADGTSRHVRINGTPIFDQHRQFIGYRGTGQDVTEQVTAERDAHRAQAQLQDAIESIGEGFELYDNEHRLVMCNQRAHEMFPAIADVMIPGVHLSDLIRAAADRGLVHTEVDDIDAWITRRMEARQVPSGEIEVSLPDGRHIRISERRTREGGTVTIRSDITALRKIEEKLRESEKLGALGQLAGGIAHDFNNLLMVIHGYAKRALEQSGATDASAASLAEVLSATEKAKALTSQMLLFSRRKRMERRLVRLNDLMREVETLLAPLLGDSIDLVIQWPQESILTETDPALLAQVLVNLAVNARDAMPTGGRLRLALDHVGADAAGTEDGGESCPDGHARLVVQDEGSGMDPQTVSRIFEPFFTTKDQGKGTGLGLAMVHGFIEQSGGTITVVSAPGEGTIFTILLPVVNLPAENALPTDSENLRSRGETILLAEDNPSLRRLMELTLMELGYKVISASDGFEALELEDNHKGTIHLAVSDVIMPGLRGTEFARSFLEARPDSKVILISGYPARGDNDETAIPDGVPMLRKPVDPQDLARTIRQTIDAA